MLVAYEAWKDRPTPSFTIASEVVLVVEGEFFVERPVILEINEEDEEEENSTTNEEEAIAVMMDLGTMVWFWDHLAACLAVAVAILRRWYQLFALIKLIHVQVVFIT